MSEPMDLIYKDPKYPSSKVVNGLSMAGPRAHLRGMGLVNEELASRLSASSIPITRCIPGTSTSTASASWSRTACGRRRRSL